MKDENKTKKELINELIELRQRIADQEKSLYDIKKELGVFRKTAADVEKELENISSELAISLYEVFEALKKIASGDPEIRISEESEVEIISKLKYMVNMTAKNIGEIVDQSHEFAIVLAEHFDVLHRVSKGELTARVSGESQIELLEALKKVTNEMIESIEREIIEREKAQEAMMESEEKYRTLINDAEDAIILTDLQGNLMETNKRAEELLGYTKKELLSMHFTQIPPKEALERAVFIFNEMVRKGSWSFADGLILKKKDGEKIHVDMAGSVIEYSGKKVTQGIFRDITERKKLEAQLFQAQKMEAIGQLAGGIAHDFNNILTAILGYGNLLQMQIGEDNPLSVYIAHIQSSAERAANLTQSLLTFSRKQLISPKALNLNETIRVLEKLLERIIGEDIALSTVLTDKALTVIADNHQLEQVLMNLAINARDAMPNGGVLIIRTELVEFDKEFIRTHGYGKPGFYALISVEDTGIGIDEKIKERIFEPFFTTKDVGKGTGLGLSIVYGIVKQHDGYINVYSEPGRGTNFRIYLPLIRLKVGDTTTEDFSILKKGTETVLIAEDDAIVREFLKEVLIGFGYSVVEAYDGERAISVFTDNKDRVQLLILDAIMPKKDGKEVYDQIKKVKPSIKAIFLSGYSADIIHEQGMVEEGFDFISKPVMPHKLLLKVREVLDR